MGSKMGRPKISNPRNVDVKVRFTSEENQKLSEYAKKNNITRAETIRTAVNLLLSRQ